MGKRFADTALYDHGWFRKLPPRLKCTWDWLCRRCDEIGLLTLDIDRLTFEIGEPVTLEEIQGHLPIQILAEDKVFITNFVSFQYGDTRGRLSLTNRFHRSIAEKLQARGFPQPLFKPIDTPDDPIPMGVDTPPTPVGSGQGKGIGKGIGRGKGFEEGGMGEETFEPTAAREEINDCVEEWQATLKHFEINRPVGELDQLEITRAFQRFGPSWVKLAFQGARKQKASPRFDPKQFVSLRIYLDPKRIERLVNIGSGKESTENVDWTKVFGGAA